MQINRMVLFVLRSCSTTSPGSQDNPSGLKTRVPSCSRSIDEIVFLQVWMITGDKQETAINIAIACKLVHHIKDLLIVNAHESEEAAKARLQELLALCRTSGATAEGGCAIKVGLWPPTACLASVGAIGLGHESA